MNLFKKSVLAFLIFFGCNALASEITEVKVPCEGDKTKKCIYSLDDVTREDHVGILNFERGYCREGEKWNCENIERLEQLNDDIRKPFITIISSGNPIKREAFYKELCEKADSIGCFKLAELHHNNNYNRDIHKATALYVKACELGHIKACYIAGVLFYDGKDGVEKDYDKAEKLLNKSCSEKLQKSCYKLGSLYEFGVKKGKEEIISSYEGSCSNAPQYGWGCFSLGSLYFSGIYVEKNIPKAINYFEKSCDSGNVFGCNTLGKINYEGVHIKNDLEKAKEFYAKSCVVAGRARGLCKEHSKINN